MNPFFLLLICGFAVWRGAELVAFDNGPFRLFKHLRDSCKGHPVLCELLTCAYCVSGYLALIAASWIAYFRFIDPIQLPLWWFGIWGAAMAVMRAVRERE